ncbi:hypothetical protein [Gabonibacter massiliensis]|uniref:hypothetical protein n=1 Tax=Gabonibacter massiliensis TaxID=1720195 RepID=UPI0012B600C3|nr:hypothetical protein [Gabonibacter massiliensis]
MKKMEFVIRSVAMLRWNGGKSPEGYHSSKKNNSRSDFPTKNVANEGILLEQGQTDED